MSELVQDDYSHQDITIDYKNNLLYSNLTYHDPLKYRSGRYSKILYNDGNEEKSIIISTPYLKVCKSIFFRENNCYIEVELGRKDKDFFIFLTQLEENNLKVILEKSEKWFGVTIPLDVLEEYQQQLVRINKNGCPKMKINIPIINNIPIVNNIEEGDIISLLIEYDGIKFLKQQFISVWKFKKMRNENSEYEFGDNYLFDDSDILSSFNDIYKSNLDTLKEDNSNLEEDNSNLEEDNSNLENTLVESSRDNEISDNMKDSLDEDIKNSIEKINKYKNYEITDENNIKCKKKKSTNRKKLIFSTRQKIIN